MGLRLPLGGTRDRGRRAPPAPPPGLDCRRPLRALSLALSCGQPIARRRSHRGPVPRISVATVARSSPYVKAISFSLAEALSPVGGLTAQQRRLFAALAMAILARASTRHAAIRANGCKLQDQTLVRTSAPGSDRGPAVRNYPG